MFRKIGDRLISINSKSYQQALSRLDSIIKNKIAVQKFEDILVSKIGTERAKNVNPAPSVFNKKTHYDRENLLLKSGANAADIDLALRDTPLKGLGADFVRAEKRHGVNAWFLAGLAAHESGMGRSAIARTKNNLFGFQAYDSSPMQSARAFSTRQAGIDHVAGYISREYLDNSGAHFSGISVDAVGKKYATDPNWANGVVRNINELVAKSKK